MMDRRAKTSINYGFPLFTIAILLMIAGYIIENGMDDYDQLGSVMFTVGFWLFFIPIIIIFTVLGIIIIAMVINS